jgi:hypothetical protein
MARSEITVTVTVDPLDPGSNRSDQGRPMAGSLDRGR